MPLDVLVLGSAAVFTAGGAVCCRARRLAGWTALDDETDEPKTEAPLARARSFLRSKLTSKLASREVEEPTTKLEPWVERAASPTTGTPWMYQCPIGLVPMRDPVRAADGVVYDRDNISEWLRKGQHVSPVTGEPLAATRLRAEKALKREIDAWRDAQANGESTKRIDVCIHDFGEIAGIALRRQPQANQQPVVSHVIPGSLAATAGVRPGDRLVSVDAAPLPEDAQGPELVAIVAHAGRPVHLSLVRTPGTAGTAGFGSGTSSSVAKGEHIIL